MSDDKKKDLTEQVEDSRISFSALADKNQKKGKADRVTTIVLLLICVALAIYFIFGAIPERKIIAAETEETSMSINVQTLGVERGRFESYTRLNGEIKSENTDVGVLPDAAGTVSSILVKRGSEVRKDDVIAYIDPSRPRQVYNESPVTSPVDGVITSIPVSVGESVTAASVIATVSGEKSLYVETELPERYIGTLSVGMGAEIYSVASPDVSYTASVAYISPSINTATRSADVDLVFTSESSSLMEGMYVTVNLITEAYDDVLMVPSSAVSEYGDDEVVYIAADGKAERRVVETGSSNGDVTIILSGLDEGESVITAGTVADGSSINILNAGEEV